jgi:hypothetical protein
MTNRGSVAIAVGLFLLVPEIPMTEYIRAKIKDRDMLEKVFPLPRDSADAPEVGKFILSIIDQTIPVRKLRSNTGSFYYVSDIDQRFVIMPSWIEYFQMANLVLTCSNNEDCAGLVVFGDGNVIVLGS